MVSMPSSRPKTVLVIEDSPVQAFSLVQLLERSGLSVLCAPNGASGLAMAQGFVPDLIVLDVQMPEMDGLAVCKALRAETITTNIPIIFLTSYPHPEVIKAGLAGGAVDFIPKDAFSDFVLLETLRELKLIESLSPTNREE